MFFFPFLFSFLFFSFLFVCAMVRVLFVLVWFRLFQKLVYIYFFSSRQRRIKGRCGRIESELAKADKYKPAA